MSNHAAIQGKEITGIPLGGVPVQVHFDPNQVEPGTSATGRVSYETLGTATTIALEYYPLENVQVKLTAPKELPAEGGSSESPPFIVTPAAGTPTVTILVVAIMNGMAGVGYLHVLAK